MFGAVAESFHIAGVTYSNYDGNANESVTNQKV